MLLIVPGFVTAAIGLLLLFPPTRVLARAIAKRRFQGRVSVHRRTAVGGRHLDGPDDVIDV